MEKVIVMVKIVIRWPVEDKLNDKNAQAAELAELKLDCANAIHAESQAIARAERAEAALAEALKALKLAEQMMTKDSLCEAERLEEGLLVVRRALTGGKEDG